MSEPSDLEKLIMGNFQAQITAAITNVITGDEVMRTFVVSALNQPVDKRDGGYGKAPFLEQAVSGAVREAAQRAVYKLLADRQDDIEALVLAHIVEHGSELAKQMVSRVADAARQGYGFNIDVTIKDHDDRR